MYSPGAGGLLIGRDVVMDQIFGYIKWGDPTSYPPYVHTT